jgi:hypothetical protein
MNDDKTKRYLGFIAGEYEVVDYSFTAVADGTLKVFVPANSRRVLLSINTSAAMFEFIGLKGVDIELIRFPILTGTRSSWLFTYQQHFILPSLEIWYRDVVAGQMEIFGLVKT